MDNPSIYVSELSASRHIFTKYHFCRGNSTRRKTRIGIILKGRGSYIYLNKRLPVFEGDAVFIPENVYCYSEWHGDPGIEVVYLSCFIHYDTSLYGVQKLSLSENTKDLILQISELLGRSQSETFEGYSLFYKVLVEIFPQMIPSGDSLDKTLQSAIEYINSHRNEDFSVPDLAKYCCVSESTLYHLFKSELGQTPIRFLNSVRVNIAIEHLENSSLSVSNISRLVGFNSENHFRRVFFDLTGTTPLKYRKSK